MAQTLGISDDAAQKRVSRAVERLREFFAKRGVTIGASGLVVVITANAVQAAPVDWPPLFPPPRSRRNRRSNFNCNRRNQSHRHDHTAKNLHRHRRSLSPLEPEFMKRARPRNCASKTKRSSNSKRRWPNKSGNCSASATRRRTGWPDY